MNCPYEEVCENNRETCASCKHISRRDFYEPVEVWDNYAWESNGTSPDKVKEWTP